ncbi:histone chaperone ASF1-like [Penaeus monodon]|uniref:histone chaperone ASF1-like n=1 Tax=Penaeus monodon TaxID=6687 RepID=UPI0018A6DF7A|nr:histone chaperone ASF1-like [Penaeus monodon]
MEKNLLGLDVINSNCAILDLCNFKLAFHEYVPDLPLSVPRTTVNVEGQDTELKVDTGCEPVIIGPLSLAKQLYLHLVPMDIEILGVGYTTSVKYVAKDLCIKGNGQMIHCRYTVSPEETPEWSSGSYIGVKLFYGTQMQFNPDGTFEYEFIVKENWAVSQRRKNMAMAEESKNKESKEEKDQQSDEDEHVATEEAAEGEAAEDEAAEGEAAELHQD